MFVKTESWISPILWTGKQEHGRRAEAFVTDWLIILIMVFIRYVLNTHVETNQMALYISICLADAV